jgi:hypothetical protein
MSEKIGVYDKYVVTKKVGICDPDAEYFVLRIDTDPHARVALKAYAQSILEENRNLAFDLLAKVAKYEGGFLNIHKDDQRITGTD